MKEVMDWYDEIDRKYRKRLELVARGMLYDKEAAEDFVQETFLEFLNQCETLNDLDHIDYWLIAVLKNKIWSYNQRAFLHREEELTPTNEPSAEDTYGEGFFDQLPEGLKEHERKILYLHIEAGHSHEEIGKILGCSAVASRMRFSRAKAHCKRLMEEKREDLCYNLGDTTKIKDRRCSDV